MVDTLNYQGDRSFELLMLHMWLFQYYGREEGSGEEEEAVVQGAAQEELRIRGLRMEEEGRQLGAQRAWQMKSAEAGVIRPSSAEAIHVVPQSPAPPPAAPFIPEPPVRHIMPIAPIPAPVPMFGAM